jgi:hypothetical protein
MLKHRSLYFLLLIPAISMLSNALSPPDPPFNDIQSQGISSLDFTRTGNNAQIAVFIINSNTTTGFDVLFEFTNVCKFQSGAQEIPMTSLLLNEVSGTLGTGLTRPVNVDILNHLISGNQYLWDPGPGQSDSTWNYIVDLKASWTAPVRALAGFYFERVSATIRAGL